MSCCPLFPEATALLLALPAPYPESLDVGHRVFEAIIAHWTSRADLDGRGGRCAPYGEENAGVGPDAGGAVLPHQAATHDGRARRTASARGGLEMRGKFHSKNQAAMSASSVMALGLEGW